MTNNDEGMKAVFKSEPGKQPELFPVNIFDMIPDNHPVRLVNQVVDQLDISRIMSKYKGGGTSSFHPRMMLKVLFYSYLSNIYSCRKMEKALQENIHFMWLSGRSTPDFRTINYFRGRRLKDEIDSLFTSIVKMLFDLGHVSLQKQYIDGTKIESVANRYTFVWKKSVEKNKAKLDEKIKKVLAEIHAQIKSDNEDNSGPDNGVAFNSEELKKKISEINEAAKQKGDITKDTIKQIKKIDKEFLPKLKQYEEQLETLDGRNSYSKTDPDATFMRLKDDHLQSGQLKPSYNAQISTENQFLTHYSIHQTTVDTTTLEGHLDGFEQRYEMQSTEVIADAGYGSEENYEMLEGKNIDGYVKYNYFHKEQSRSWKNNPFIVQNLHYNAQEDYYVCPMGQKMQNIGKKTVTSTNGYERALTIYEAQRCQGCPMRGQCHNRQGNRKIEVSHRLNELKARARELLNSDKGLEHRSRRPVEVEAVFGQMKFNNRFTRFTHRRLDKVTMEFALMAIGHNLRKLAAKINEKGHLIFIFISKHLLRLISNKNQRSNSNLIPFYSLNLHNHIAA